MIDEPPLDAPDEDWLVWADAMQQIGDPRGELLALGHPPEYVHAHADALLGKSLGAHLRADHLRVTKWRRYRPDEIEFRIADEVVGPSLVIDLAASPLADTLRSLSITGVGKIELRRTLGWFRESSLAGKLTSLALVDDDARSQSVLESPLPEPPPNSVVFGPLNEVWLAMPQLEHLKLVVADPGQIQYGLIRLPALRSFTLHPLCWADGLGSMFARARWPQLASLELRVCETRVADQIIGLDWENEFTPLIEALRALPLERLAITSFLTRGVLDVLEQELPPTLVELDLSDSAFDEDAAARLARNPVLHRLHRLVIERVRLRSAMVFGDILPEVRHSCSPTSPSYYYFIEA